MYLCALIVLGPAYRSLLDKILTVKEGIELVGQWSQVQSTMDLISAPAFVGVGMGVTILTAQSNNSRQKEILISGILIGLVSGLVFAATAIVVQEPLALFIGFTSNKFELEIWAILCSYTNIPILLLNGYFLGQRRTEKVLTLTLATIVPIILSAIYLNFRYPTLDIIKVLQISTITNLTIIGYFFIRNYSVIKNAFNAKIYIYKTTIKLLPFTMTGFIVGTLTPLSSVIIRTEIYREMNWQSVGIATALWRTSDWILSVVNSTLYYFFLPIASIEAAAGRITSLISTTFIKVFLPALLAFIILFVFQDTILTTLYNHEIDQDSKITAYFWIGDIFRMYSGILIFALYTIHANKAIIIGEFFSQPLLAFTLMMGFATTISSVGTAHLFTYIAFAILNSYFIYIYIKPKYNQ